MAIGRRLSSGWMIQEWELFARDDPNMTKLRLSIPHIDREYLRASIRCLRSHRYLEELWLEGDELEIDVAHSLALSLRENKNLKVLKVRNCSLSGHGASVIFDAIRTSQFIQELHLERNELSDSSIDSLCSMIRKNPILKVLHIVNNPVGLQNFQKICESLRQNIGIQELCLQHGHIGGSDYADSLGRMVLRNRCLKRLQLVHTKMKSNDVQILSKYLEQNKTLEQLVLAGSKLDEVAALALSELVKKSKSLKQFSLWGNSLGDDGANLLYEGIQCNSTLIELRIMMNLLTEKSIPGLANAVMNHPTLKVLDIASNCGCISGEYIANLLRQNDRIETIGLYGNELGQHDDEIKKLLRLNKAGRRVIKNPNSSKSDILNVLIKNHNDTDLLFCILQERPDFLKI